LTLPISGYKRAIRWNLCASCGGIGVQYQEGTVQGMFQSKLLSIFLVVAAALAVHSVFGQEKQSSLKRAQALLAGQSGESLLSSPAGRLKPLPGQAAGIGRLRAQSLTQPQTIDLIGIGDLDKFSLPASGKNRAAIPGMTHAGLTENRVDKPVELKSMPALPVPASKLRGDVPPQPVPLP
jgi:hypothetical protein